MAYGLRDLRLTGLQVQTILSVHIEHRPGEHGRMELTADLGEQNEDFPIHETGSGQNVVLYGDKAGKQEPVFSGIITRLEVKSVGKSYHVILTAYTTSYLMDIAKKSRSFQDVSMTMGSLMSQIVQEYGGEAGILFADGAIGEIAVQYEETDWQFLKRMLSGWHIPIAGSEVRDKVCLYCGTAQIPERMSIISVEESCKDMDGLSYWQEMGEGVRDEDFIRYRIKLDNCIPLYAQVDYRGRSLIVTEVEYRTVGSTLYEFVTLQKREGILQPPIYPMELVGTALEGTILNIKGEKVQIHLNIDDGYSSNDCYWFPFSTPSASSDGSGWYCMPEKGDKVRIYFPSKKTGDVIAISAVSTYDPTKPAATASGAGAGRGNTAAGGQSGTSSYNGGNGNSYDGGSGGGSGGGGASGTGGSSGGGASGAAGSAGGAAAAGADAKSKKKDSKDKMGDPTTKYLRVPSGHAIKLTSKGIEIRCSGGSVYIEMLKTGRINISADENIQISAEENITLKAKRTMSVRCKETSYLCSQMGGSMYLNEEGKLIIQGTEVHMN